MLDVRFDGKLNYIIDDIGFVNVLRNAGFEFVYSTGKDRYSLIVVQNGSIEYRFIDTNETVRLTKGKLLFIPKNYPYVAKYLEDNTIIRILTFDTDSTAEFLTSPVLKKLNDFSDSFNIEGARSTAYLAARVYDFLDILEKETKIVPKKYHKIIPAIEEIGINYFENKKISFYSDMCSMSESNFRKLFKEYTGKSPIEYRNLIRISEVKKMIDSGEFTVSEAAYLAGFNNMSFFYDVYNKTRHFTK